MSKILSPYNILYPQCTVETDLHQVVQCQVSIWAIQGDTLLWILTMCIPSSAADAAALDYTSAS